MTFVQQPREGRDNPPSFTGKSIESPGAPRPGLRPPGQTERVLGTQDTKLPDHSPTATLPRVLGSHQWDGLETPVCPQTADMGRVRGSTQRGLPVWTVLTSGQYKGMACSILAPPSVFLSETCPAVPGSLTHLSHRYLLTLSKCGRALGLRDESECGGLQGSHGSLFSSLFPQTGDLGAPVWLSFFLPFLFALDSFPRSPGCLKRVSSGVCNPCAPSCGPQRMATHLAPLPTRALC